MYYLASRAGTVMRQLIAQYCNHSAKSETCGVEEQFLVLLSRDEMVTSDGHSHSNTASAVLTTACGNRKAKDKRQLPGLDGDQGDIVGDQKAKAATLMTLVFRRLMNLLKYGEHFDAFADLYISPVSLHYVESLQKIHRRRIGGIFRLSDGAGS
jgi:hypothetical protein